MRITIPVSEVEALTSLQVVLLIFSLTVAFAALIWYGMYDNPIDSVKLAQVSSFLHVHSSRCGIQLGRKSVF